jgi:hypothetical protein
MIVLSKTFVCISMAWRSAILISDANVIAVNKDRARHALPLKLKLSQRRGRCFVEMLFIWV